ncbi:MAG: hypothetical protein RLZZ584_2058, partial [Pseudomonadota bacterium]
SLYTAFAPLDEPRVALAVIVENSGFGAEAAAPIARRVLDYLVLGNYPSPEDIALAQKGQAGAPVGQPRRAVDVPLPPQRNSLTGAPSPAASAAPAQARAPATIAAARPAGSAPAAATRASAP